MTDAKCPHCATPFRLGADLQAARDKIAELEADHKRLCDWMGEAVSRVEQMGVLGLVDDADLFDIFREAAHQQAHHND
jgi:hypothetical protein